MSKLIDAFELVTNVVSVTSGSGVQTVSATAPTGKKVTGGGFDHDGNLNAFSAFPDSDLSAWNVKVFNQSGQARDITVYAICVG